MSTKGALSLCVAFEAACLAGVASAVVLGIGLAAVVPAAIVAGEVVLAGATAVAVGTVGIAVKDGIFDPRGMFR